MVTLHRRNLWSLAVSLLCFRQSMSRVIIFLKIAKWFSHHEYFCLHFTVTLCVYVCVYTVMCVLVHMHMCEWAEPGVTLAVTPTAVHLGFWARPHWLWGLWKRFPDFLVSDLFWILENHEDSKEIYWALSNGIATLGTKTCLICSFIWLFNNALHL